MERTIWSGSLENESVSIPSKERKTQSSNLVLIGEGVSHRDRETGYFAEAALPGIS
jgi:hypothetical protein